MNIDPAKTDAVAKKMVADFQTSWQDAIIRARQGFKDAVLAAIRESDSDDAWWFIEQVEKLEP